MTKEQHESALKELKAEFDIKKGEIDKVYAFDNCPYKIGDIVKDHFHILKIERLNLSYNYSGPTIRFIGTELDKKLIPTKRQSDPNMYLDNVKEKLN